ncbi:MAG: 3-phosphoshikimate 1-carboxyvinyltransferase [Desulfovibrionaceae bacterium]
MSNEEYLSPEGRQARSQRRDARPGDRSGHGDKARRPGRDGERHQPLRETVADIDRNILKMLVKRYNCIQRMAGQRGHLDPREEKFLRESWEKNAGRMSRDARLIRQMFALMQEVDFLPRREPGEELRQGFNLAPARTPVNIRMTAPVSSRKSRVWIALAAMTGAARTIPSTLLNDAVVDCCKMCNQLGAAVSWQENGTVVVRGGEFALQDKVVFVGDDLFNFALLLGRYVGCHSRAKFTGDSSLKFADLSAVRRYLPMLGARLVNAMPKSDGFPVRLECSGVLPDSTMVPEDLPSEIVEGLMLAAPFWDRPVTFDLSRHPRAEAMLGFVLPLLMACGVSASVHGLELSVKPGMPDIPEQPRVPVDLSLNAALLALSAVTGGEVRLHGAFPSCPVVGHIRAMLNWAGVNVAEAAGVITAQPSGNAMQAPLDASAFSAKLAPLAVGLAAFLALKHDAPVRMPSLPEELDRETVEGFLQHAGLDLTADGMLARCADNAERPAVWTAPAPQWALALALASFARAGLKLSNAGIMTRLYPSFWALFNSLPDPELKRAQEQPDEQPVVRRRIITSQPATFRERDSDD